MTWYLDSSAVMRYLLRHDGRIDLKATSATFVSSEILELECKRTLIRYRLTGNIDDNEYADLGADLNEFVEGVSLIAVNSEIIRSAAENWGVVVGSLDSIHLATALAYKTQLQLITHDKALARSARIKNIHVIDQ